MTLRSPRPHEGAVLVAGRDPEFHRFLGEGSSDPRPTAIVLLSGDTIAGWVDYDTDRDWLTDGEINLGYNTFPQHRGRGVTQRAVNLLLDWLADDHELTTATLLIDPANHPSIGVAVRCGFTGRGDVDGELLFERPLRAAG